MAVLGSAGGRAAIPSFLSPSPDARLGGKERGGEGGGKRGNIVVVTSRITTTVLAARSLRLLRDIQRATFTIALCSLPRQINARTLTENILATPGLYPNDITTPAPFACAPFLYDLYAFSERVKKRDTCVTRSEISAKFRQVDTHEI